jgi:hypothetical protein
MITTGVSGNPWRAAVTPWGSVEPWDSTPPLNWYIAADDRWHVPANEPTVRQRRVEGTAVVETRIRIPDGDAVQRVYSVAYAPGFTVIEVENESSMPIAIAFDRRDLRTERPVVDMPIEGIELPPGSFVVPVGHRSSIRVAIAHDGSGAGALPAGLPSAAEVVRGWNAVIQQASTFSLPAGDRGSLLAEAVTGERCELALGGLAHADEDPAAFCLGLGELSRQGERLDPWLPELVAAVEHLGRIPGWDADVALEAAGRVLRAAGEARAERDLDRIISRRGPLSAPPPDPPGGVRDIAWLEGRLARGTALLPEGMPPSWLGANFEVNRIPIGRDSTVSYAIRWHGERPAVLWEITGEPQNLSAPRMDPHWHTTEVSGEALWAVPHRVDLPEAAPTAVPTQGDVSFS